MASSAPTLAQSEQPKWTEEDCAAYKNAIDLKYGIFNRASDALREDLKFQYDSALTLYMVDRAVDTATSLAAGQLFKGGQALYKSRSGVQAARMIDPALSGPGVGNIFVGESALSTTGQALAYSTPLLGFAGEQALGYSMSQPFNWGTDAVRNDIQNLMDNSDVFVEGLASDLNFMRDVYRENCPPKD